MAPRRNVCDGLGYALTGKLSGDLAEAEGAYVMDRTHDLATVLSLCPDQFCAFMHSHPRELNAWLGQADRFLFLGDEPYKTVLEKYRAELIGVVDPALQGGHFAEERKQIKDHLQRMKVEITQ